jgi:hypothetical protein
MDFKSQLNATVDVLKLLLIQENESITIDRARSLAQTDNTAGTSFFSTNPIWRQMIVEWYYSIIDQVGADRELVYIAMDILDRFLDVKTSYLKDKKEYEKAVIASLLISTKLYADEYICPKELLQLTSSSITSRDIMDTAVDIYESLSWNHSIPTAARFVHTLVKLLPENFTKKSRADIFENAIYQIELSVQDAICSSQPASLVAWMAVENGLETAIFLSPDERHEFRSRVSKTTGHEYSTELRNRLRGFQANVVLSDETKEIHHVSLKPRSLKDIPVVSMHEIDLV